MMLLDEVGSKAPEVAATIMKSINDFGLEVTLCSLAQEKFPKKKLERLKKDIDSKEVISFDLVEKTGRKRKVVYRVLIDLKNKEVEVNAIKSEVKLQFFDYKAK